VGPVTARIESRGVLVPHAREVELGAVAGAAHAFVGQPVQELQLWIAHVVAQRIRERHLCARPVAVGGRVERQLQRAAAWIGTAREGPQVARLTREQVGIARRILCAGRKYACDHQAQCEPAGAAGQARRHASVLVALQGTTIRDGRVVQPVRSRSCSCRNPGCCSSDFMAGSSVTHQVRRQPCFAAASRCVTAASGRLRNAAIAARW
jgi:hypothetical protein